MLSFDWNPGKARSNARKHGVTFEEAASVFLDEYAVQFHDENHDDHEHRFIMLGLSRRLRLLVVVHAERNDGRVIRVISARKATRREQSYYRPGGK